MKHKIEEINLFVKNELHFEFEVYSYNKKELVIVGSKDFLYYHEIEIHFVDVLFISGNFSWHVVTSENCLSLIEEEKFIDTITKYHIQEGYQIFGFNCEDTEQFYIVAKDFWFEKRLEKYYE